MRLFWRSDDLLDGTLRSEVRQQPALHVAERHLIEHSTIVREKAGWRGMRTIESTNASLGLLTLLYEYLHEVY